MKKVLLLVAATLILLLAFSPWTRLNPQTDAPEVVEAPPDIGKVSPDEINRLVELMVSTEDAPQAVVNAVAGKLRQRLQRGDARAKEAVLSFASAEAYQAFLARAGRAGLRVLARLDNLNTVRVGYESLDGFARDVLGHAADYSQVAANFLVGVPPTPPEAQARAARNQVPLGNTLLSFLGATGDTSNWGRGVTIAVLDSGVGSDATFGLGRLRAIDIGLGTTPAGGTDGGHGTAVAALAGGMSADARGVAPASDLLSIRVTDKDGKSDIFSVAQGIVAAVDAGAKIINISLGGYGTNTALNLAIDHALERGAVVVAAAGNDQAGQLTWPAADPRVVSVGAVDATGQQVIFSNSGQQLQVTAPGLGIQTAWTDGARVFFDGTSASAPVVSGAIAAVLSQQPGLTPAQAWQVLQTHTSEAGAPGADPDYGNGVLNLGWAMARNDALRTDTAVASHYYDSANGQMAFVLQNRSARAVAGLTLDVDVNGAPRRYPVSWLGAGATSVVTMPLSTAQLVAAGKIEFRTELSNPAGVTDQVPANNRRASAISVPAPANKSTR